MDDVGLVMFRLSVLPRNPESHSNIFECSVELGDVYVLYRVAQVDVENLPLSLNWDVSPCCLGSR